MKEPVLTPCHPERPVPSVTTPELLAEQHLARRILSATAIAMPVGAVFFGALVALAAAIAHQPVAIPAAMGAVIGVLAGSFFGMWAGFVASVSELDLVDLHLDEVTDEAGTNPEAEAPGLDPAAFDRLAQGPRRRAN